MIDRVRLALAAFSLAIPLAVSAHAKLRNTSPAAGATLTAAPKALTLDFNEDVHLALLTLSVRGKPIEVRYDRAASTSHVVVELPPLAAGSYEVRWSALTADDGHVVKGSFSFVIEP